MDFRPAMLFAAALLLPAAGVLAADAPAAPQAFAGEQLLFDVPDGWRVVQTRSIVSGAQHSRVMVMAPQKPEPGMSSEQLVAMTLVHDHTLPAHYLQTVAAQAQRLCAQQTVSPAQASDEDGYLSQTQHRYCRQDKRDGLCRTFVTKALGGHDSLYVVSYVKAYACAEAERFSADEARQWSDYFDAVSICDKRRSDCPAEGAPVPRIST